MRKLSFIGLLIFILFLAACGIGGSAEADEVFQQAVEASEKMESAEMNMKMNQVIEGDPEMGAMVMEMDMQAEMTLDPLAMHQKGTMAMEIQGMPINSEIEMYMTEEAIYMFESMSQMWIKMDDAMMPAELAELEQNPADQLEILEGYIDDIEFEEDDDIYIYRFNGEGEEVAEFTDRLIEENLGAETFTEMGIEMNQMMEGLEINSIFYEIHIDKETYEITKVITNMDLALAVDDNEETMQIQQEATVEYTGINSVDSIEVPQDVLDSAQELY